MRDAQSTFVLDALCGIHCNESSIPISSIAAVIALKPKTNSSCIEGRDDIMYSIQGDNRQCDCLPAKFPNTGKVVNAGQGRNDGIIGKMLPFLPREQHQTKNYQDKAPPLCLLLP